MQPVYFLLGTPAGNILAGATSARAAVPAATHAICGALMSWCCTVEKTATASEVHCIQGVEALAAEPHSPQQVFDNMPGLIATL